MAPNNDLLQVKDYDVLGIGAVRRAELEVLGAPFELLLHPQLVPSEQKEIYESILAQTKEWLKPARLTEQKIVGANEDILFHLLLADFKKYFPRTTVALSDRLSESLRAYLHEFSWQGPLLTDHFRYFAIFLKSRFQDQSLYEVAQKEWLWSYLSFADFGSVKTEPGRVSVNPSLQILNSSKDLYVLYFNATTAKVCEHKMDVVDAAVVDTLQEDRKYSLDQVIDQVLMMDLPQPITQEEGRKRVYFLISRGILLESDPNAVLHL